MKIDFGYGVKFFEKRIAYKVARTALKWLNQPMGVELSFSLIGEEEMKQLNNRMRNVDKVTDVLSFPNLDIRMGEKVQLQSDFGTFLGDIVVCRAQIERQAKEYGNTYKEELCRMVLHSVLHLLGYDHIEPKDEEVMRAVEAPIYCKIVHIKQN